MKRPTSHIIGALIVSLSLVSGGIAYVRSAERMLEPLLKAYRGIHTVKIDMETTIYDDPSRKTEVDEHLVIQDGGRFRAEREFPRGANILVQNGRETVTMGVETSHPGARRIDTVFPTVFFQQSSDALLNALNFLGVDTQTVGVDRIEREVVFVIGRTLAEGPGSRLWVERERGLPLRFVGIGISDGETVVLRAEYKEYRQVDEDVWFPGRVEYYRDDTLWVVSMVRSVTLNEALADTLFTVDAGSPVTYFLNIKE